MNRVTLYSKAECHLCEEARDILERVRRDLPFTLDQVLLREGEEKYEEYASLVPVVEVNGERQFVYRVNEKRLRALLAGGKGE